MNVNNEIFLYNRTLRKNAAYNVWFAFPGPESFALSSLGYLWLFRQIDLKNNVNIERVYSDTKTTAIMRDKVNLIGFSLSFDTDFLEVFKILSKNNISFLAQDRKEYEPLLYAGGPVVTANPEPYKNIFDFIVIGDGEDINNKVIEICQTNMNKPKSEVLELLSHQEGIYVPSFPQKKVKKITKKLSECIYTPIISKNSFFPNTFILELERGCANRCGFCLASYINLPIRCVDYNLIIETIELGLKYTNKIALLGAQITAHPEFEKICKYIDDKIKSGQKIEMGISSLRVDSFKENIVNTLVDAGQKHLTLAIEAGSERLRKTINKNLSEVQIFEAIKVAVNCGLKGIKFYAMVGIPSETQEDIDEIIELGRKIKANYKGLSISFGFSTFVPKANTPFQWMGRQETKKLEKTLEYIRKEFHKIGIEVNLPSPKWDYYQAVLSRGDSNLTEYLIKVYEYGGKLGAFKKAAKELKINTDYYAIENYSFAKQLPWDFIDIKPGKDFLIKENQRLLG